MVFCRNVQSFRRGICQKLSLIEFEFDFESRGFFLLWGSKVTLP